MTGTPTSLLTVFSDLDGTLLDHDTYSWEAAKPAIERLAACEIPLVLASSKTAAEMSVMQSEMGISHWPAIVENGAGVTDGKSGDLDRSEYDTILKRLTAVPAVLRAKFRGFGQMSDQEVADITGLSLEKASKARFRAFSEPGLWRGTDEELNAFGEALAEQGISMRRGGRFLTLSFGRTKADGMRDIVEKLGATMTLALGDAPNDAEMLDTADFGVIIRNDHAPEMPALRGLQTGKITKTTKSGPEGWNQAVLEFVERYDSRKAP